MEPGQRYVEVPLTEDTEKIRATIVHGGPRGPVAVRLQILDARGHLRQGPEVAVKDFAALNQELFTALATALATAIQPWSQPVTSEVTS